LFSLCKVFGGLVLSSTGSQRRLDRADERHGLYRAFLERDVAQLVDEAERIPVPPPFISTRGQEDKQKIRPGRLVAYPVKQGIEISSKECFLGDHGGAGAALQLPHQVTEPRAGCTGQACLLQEGARSARVSTGRGEDEYTLALWARDRLPGHSFV